VPGFLEEIIVAQLVKIFPIFIDPEDSLSYSKQPDTGPYP
jgi:hypothetical protein